MFPLYDQITSRLDSDDTSPVSDECKMDFLEFVNKSDAAHEIIYVLVRVYQIHNDQVNEMPYNSKRQKKGIKFDLEKLPLQLQKVLVAFSKM